MLLVRTALRGARLRAPTPCVLGLIDPTVASRGFAKNAGKGKGKGKGKGGSVGDLKAQFEGDPIESVRDTGASPPGYSLSSSCCR